jgi:hypothetical protein
MSVIHTEITVSRVCRNVDLPARTTVQAVLLPYTTQHATVFRRFLLDATTSRVVRGVHLRVPSFTAE